MATDSLRASVANRNRQDNIGSTERWASAATGFGLAVQAMKSRNPLARLLLASAGLSLLARGATGYCAMKSTLAGETTLKEGLQRQLQRLRETANTAGTSMRMSTSTSTSTIKSIDTMNSLYACELQELHSAECQLADLAEKLVGTLQNPELAVRFDEYVTELRSRKVDLESLLARADVDARPHPDDAMQALIGETQKMARVCAPKLRDAAITASLQRIVHYKIAGYGSIAAYAKALGRTEEAAHFAELADRDKTIDGELTRLAKATLNPEAVVAAEPQIPGSMRTH
jgi:ferritin-like metal-binding protein YciE